MTTRQGNSTQMQRPTAPCVAIIGGGPAGSALAVLLAEQGITPVLFDDGKRPDLVVGESTIPAVVPILRRLGIESEVAQIGVNKPGVSFVTTGSEPLHLSFTPLGERLPQYAYNVPRPAFDDCLRERAREANVHHVPIRARLVRDESNPDHIRLDPSTLDQAHVLEGHQPDLIVDATGRRRTIARLLDLPTTHGDRTDLAHFAHFENFDLTGLEQGQVVTGLMERGWSWIIPLPNRVSVGVVMHCDQMKALGQTPEDQLAAAIAGDPDLAKRSANARQVSPVVSYANYQKVTERGFGSNWVLLGDALGFVDPMFSPGLFLALESAQLLAAEIGRISKRATKTRPRAHPNGSSAAPRAVSMFQSRHARKGLARYAGQMQLWFVSWMDLIELIYSGNVLALRQAGEEWMEKFPGRISQRFNDHMEKQMACMAAGDATCSKYAWFLLRSGIRYGMRDNDPGRYRIE